MRESGKNEYCDNNDIISLLSIAYLVCMLYMKLKLVEFFNVSADFELSIYMFPYCVYLILLCANDAVSPV